MKQIDKEINSTKAKRSHANDLTKGNAWLVLVANTITDVLYLNVESLGMAHIYVEKGCKHRGQTSRQINRPQLRGQVVKPNNRFGY